jgi:hypothetical protein
MTSSASTEGPPPPGDGSEQWTLRRLIARNKRVSAAVLALIVVLLAGMVVEAVASRAAKISDATSCSAWSSANQLQQSAYAALYVREHRALPSRARDAGSVETAINDGCIQAFSFDESDTVTVLQAINHQY